MWKFKSFIHLLVVGLMVVLSRHGRCEQTPEQVEYARIQAALMDPESPESKQIREALKRRQQLAEQFLKESEDIQTLTNRLATDAKAADEFEQAMNHLAGRFENVARQALARLDPRKPEGQIAALPLIRVLGVLKDGASVDLIARYLDTPDPKCSDKLLGVTFSGLPGKYPAMSALERIGEASLAVLKKIVLSEPEDCLRVRNALHSLVALQGPKTVEKWVSDDTGLRKDENRRNNLLRLLKDIRTRNFADDKR